MKTYAEPNELFQEILDAFPPSVESNIDYIVDQQTKAFAYAINNFNSVGANPVLNPDILCMGCSVTRPLGIPHGLSWPHLMASELGCSLNVIAYVGGSVQRIVYNAVLSIAKYGIPKEIYFLLPSLDRAWVVDKSPDTKNFSLKNYFWIDQIKKYSNSFADVIRGSNYRDYIKAKRNIPLEYGFQNQIIALFMFFSMCKELGIKCNFYSWNPYSDDIFLNNNILSQVSNHSKEIGGETRWGAKLRFDPDYYSNNPKHVLFWEKGVDESETPHPGMYMHIHFAERFLGRRLSQKTIDNAVC